MTRTDRDLLVAVFVHRLKTKTPPVVASSPLIRLTMHGPFGDHRFALTGQSPLVLFRWARWSYHGTDSPLAACPAHERAQQFFAINLVGLDPSASLNRCSGNDMTLYPMRLQQAVDPEAVEPGSYIGTISMRPCAPSLRVCFQAP